MLTLRGGELTPEEIASNCYSDHQHAVTIKQNDGEEISGLLHNRNGTILFNREGERDLVLCKSYLRENVESLTFLVSL